MKFTPELIAIGLQTVTLLGVLLNIYVKVEKRLTTVEVKVDHLTKQ